MAKRGRPRKTLTQKLKDAIDRALPNMRVIERRELFSFVQAPDRLEGRNGEIDSEVYDAIGQFCALGLLDGHGHDPVTMRDKGRDWGIIWAKRMKPSCMKISQVERRSKTTNHSDRPTPDDWYFEKMDRNLPAWERSVLLSLIVDPMVGSDPMGREMTPWARALIDEALLKRGRARAMMILPGEQERELLKVAIRGLLIIVDGSLPSRRELAA